jgi:hypothetical protein
MTSRILANQRIDRSRLEPVPQHQVSAMPMPAEIPTLSPFMISSTPVMTATREFNRQFYGRSLPQYRILPLDLE